MTQAQAETTTTAAISVGYNPSAKEITPGVWKVIVKPGLSTLDLKAISDFAVANSLIGVLDSVTLS